ncbi:hypothetical protein P8452_08734 [Trifolium repens]|nr:hypothetical protein P8452_08734 [Trifolium repens]
MLVGNGKVVGSGVAVDVLHAQIRAIFYLKFENENSDQEVQHANKVVNSQGSTVISKPKSHGTVSGGLQLKFKACWCG